MWSYVTEELPALVAAEFPVDMERQAITGHSMGGHGALTVALAIPTGSAASRPSRQSLRRSRCRGGRRRLPVILATTAPRGASTTPSHSSKTVRRVDEILVDVGDADPFIEKELRPELLERACAEAGIALTLRVQPGYDHSYYFISTFMADHLRWHAERLRGG